MYKLLSLSMSKEVSVDMSKPTSIFPNTKYIFQSKIEKAFNFIMGLAALSFLIQANQETGKNVLKKSEITHHFWSPTILIIFIYILYFSPKFKVLFTAPFLNKNEDVPAWENRIPCDRIMYEQIKVDDNPKFIILFRENKHENIKHYAKETLIKKLYKGHYDFIKISTYKALKSKINPYTQKPLIKNKNMFYVKYKKNFQFEIVKFR